MQKMYTPSRFVMIFAVIVLFFSIYIFALYSLQVYQPWNLGEEQPHTRVIRRTSTIAAARGDIKDRNGILLASSRPSHRVMIDWHMIQGDPGANADILNLIYAAMYSDISHTDTFPVTRGAPFEFVTNMTPSQRARLDAYFEFHSNSIDPDISASDFLAWLRNHYSIDYTIGILDARLIIGVRYELEMRMIMKTLNPYIFAHDVSTEFVAYIGERGFHSVFTENTSIREYHTTAAPHLLGYVGPMTEAEFKIFREYPWNLPMNAIVGKMGAERAFEEYLHGREGEKRIRTSGDGTVLQVQTVREPEPGSHVYLTIDIGLQIAAENALRSQIELINSRRIEVGVIINEYGEEEEPELIPGGAVVVIDVNTGEILASASYPSFNLATLAQDWAILHTDTIRNPMFNRAIHGQFIPGSTFKMVTGFAGLRHREDITRWSQVYDTGRFDRYEHVGDGLVLYCAIFAHARRGHGWIDIVQATEVSCNFYFLQVADWLPGTAEERGDIIAGIAAEFGLGVETGIEMRENTGRLATPDVVRDLRGGYFMGDVLLTAFGQGENRFTPIQLANYAATIGNGGTRHSLSILRRVVSHDFTGEPLFVHEPEIMNVIEEYQYIQILQEGMIAASRGNRGTAFSIFGNYPIVVASKTGTAQVEGRDVNDGIFLAYAPAENPEIAVAVVVEKGGSGAAVMDIARMIFDHYFATGGAFLTSPYGRLIP